MIADQTTLALAAAECLTDDRRRFLIAGSPESIALLKEDAGALWKPVPACFKAVGIHPAFTIVGSFDGVPVAEFVDPMGSTPPGGLSFQLDGEHVGGVVFNCTVVAPVRSYHKVGDTIVEHPSAKQ